MQPSPTGRRLKCATSIYSINIVDIRNPLVVAWWSLTYPGFGHIRLGGTIKGIFLFAGELLINVHAHLNLAILYSFTGRFAMAKEVLNTRMLLVYGGILIYSVWDSYRLTVEINKFSVLADHENAPITPGVITPTGLNAMEKRNPWVAIAWSLLVPGLGQLYCVSVVSGMFMLLGGALIVYMSNLLPAVFYTAGGHFAQAKAVIDWQWLLNFPSFYIFAIYDAYTNTVEINKIFEKEQAQFLRNNYQSASFRFPSKKEESICM